MLKDDPFFTVAKKTGDAFGKALLYKYQNPQLIVNDIAERDDRAIFATNNDRYFSKYQEWSNPEKIAIKLVKGRTLDVGCGGGRHALYLQNKGFDVTGFDISPGAVKVCKAQGLKKVKLLDIEKIHTFPPKSFDTVLFMDNNFGLMYNEKKIEEGLKKIERILAPGGRIVAQNREPYFTKNPHQLLYLKLNKKRGRMPGQCTLRSHHWNWIGEPFQFLFASFEEIKKIINDTGWNITHHQQPNDRDYIFVLQKS